jgi:hypothetical protein
MQQRFPIYKLKLLFKLTTSITSLYFLMQQAPAVKIGLAMSKKVKFWPQKTSNKISTIKKYIIDNPSLPTNFISDKTIIQ